MLSQHMKVVDASLDFCKNETIQYLLKFNKDIMWSKLFNILKQNMETKCIFWNKDIIPKHQLVYDLYKNLDQSYWENLEAEWEKNKAQHI